MLDRKNANCEDMWRFGGSNMKSSMYNHMYKINFSEISMYTVMYKKHNIMYKKASSYVHFLQNYVQSYVQSNIQSGGTPNPTFFGDNTNKDISNTLECPEFGTFEGSRIALVKQILGAERATGAQAIVNHHSYRF